jgi:hypothetical protein
MALGMRKVENNKKMNSIAYDSRSLAPFKSTPDAEVTNKLTPRKMGRSVEATKKQLVH